MICQIWPRHTHELFTINFNEKYQLANTAVGGAKFFSRFGASGLSILRHCVDGRDVEAVDFHAASAYTSSLQFDY